MKKRKEKNLLPKISIITPSFNQGQYIEQTIKSVLLQDYPNLEYIVMDGGSTDGTVEILKRYNDKIKWFSEKDKGQSEAINKGLKMTTGEILAYLNSDDIYLPDTLDKVARFFGQNRNINWLTGKCRIIDEKGKETRSLISVWKNLWLKNRFLRDKAKQTLIVLNFISQPATFWKRKIMEKVGFFDKGLDLAMDYDFWLKLIRQGKLGFIDEELACFRIQKSSKGARKFASQTREGYKIAKRNTRSKNLLMIRRAHDFLAVNVYKLIS